MLWAIATADWGVDRGFGRGSRLAEGRRVVTVRIGVTSSSTSSSDSWIRVIVSAGGLTSRTASRGGWTSDDGTLRLGAAKQHV